MLYVERYHDFSAGHRIVGHESKCALIHGHNWRVHFTCAVRDDNLDKVGRVLDFQHVEALLCQWLETNWDHKFLAFDADPIINAITEQCMKRTEDTDYAYETWRRSIVLLPFNPTSENMAHYLLHIVAPNQLLGTRVQCLRVRVDETRKCSAIADAR